MEKIHGTSAHITYQSPQDSDSLHQLIFFSGGETHSNFVKLFDESKLIEGFRALGLPTDKKITIFGEAYGGKQQGMSATYGKELKFIAFDVQIGDTWLNVPDAEKIVLSLGLEFVYYTKVTLVKTQYMPFFGDICMEGGVTAMITSLDEVDRERDSFSVQAKRNGILEGKPREGIVLRPLVEMTLSNGNRVIVKHKGAAFSETKTPKIVELDIEKIKVLEGAQAIANEWVTESRIGNAVSHFKAEELSMSNFPNLLKYIVDDVLREGEGLIVVTPEVRKAISKKAAELWKIRLAKVNL